MKKILIRILLPIALLSMKPGGGVSAQGMHFSQYYNAPLLLNPANTGLMSESDFRIGLNYRDQWSKIPVPYKTFSGFADFQLFRGFEGTNWMGIGMAFFNDKAGDGELSLTKFEGNIAYHVQMGMSSMISAGISGGYGQRSVNYNKLSFNDQWDGFKFDMLSANNEQDGVINTNYFDVGAGINFAFFPNEATYIKFGVGAAHLNQPKETFYKNGTVENKMGIRPTANIDGIFNVNESFTFNPSIYFTTQKGAYEFLAGSLFYFGMGGSKDNSSKLILGGFYRWDEAAVLALGLQYSSMKFMVSYDYTLSSLSSEIKGNGGWEIGINYQGMYGSLTQGRRTINCPRF